MTVYRWPDFPVAAFELSILPNQRIFVGPYTPTVQVLDLLGERWQARITLAPTPTSDVTTASSLEAFFDRLQGQANAIQLWHLKRRSPLGTLGTMAAAGWTPGTWTPGTWQVGSAEVAADIAQLASTGQLRTVAGRTVVAGDLIGLGGQLVRVMANATANGSGLMTVEFQPRARTLIPAGTPIVTSMPTANFILKPGTTSVPTVWSPDAVQGASFDLIEVF